MTGEVSSRITDTEVQPSALMFGRGCAKVLLRVRVRIKMADYALAVQCWNHSSFATEHFQIKPLEISDLHCPLGKSYRL